MNRAALPHVFAFMMACTCAAGSLSASEETYSVAIFPFQERGAGMSGQGSDVRDLLFAGLAENTKILLVERTELDRILQEAELNLSGNVDAAQATQVGQLTGAKIMITGSVFKVANKTYLVAKIVGTETGKVLGKSVNGTENLAILAEKLAKEVEGAILESASELMPPAVGQDSGLARIRERLRGQRLPAVYINISESHVGQASKDPSAETELMYIYENLGGKVIDKEEGDLSLAEYRIIGNGFSEFATRTRGLVSVKARLEVKVLNANGEVVAVDRQTTVKVDLNEMIAAKSALQEAAMLIAERIIPKLVERKTSSAVDNSKIDRDA